MSAADGGTAGVGTAGGAGEGSASGVPDNLAIPDGLQVWFARLPGRDLDAAEREGLAAGIDEATLTRLARFVRPADRDRGLAGHALLRRLLSAVTGEEPQGIALRTWCASCGLDDHGKPYLPGAEDGEPPLQFNLSHAGSVVAVALAAPGLDVGVDVESRDRSVDWPTLRRSVFADDEWEWSGRRPEPAALRTDLWSRKEAAAKATGHGLSRSLATVRVIGRPRPEQGPGDGADAGSAGTGAAGTGAPTPWTGVSGDPRQDGDHVLGWDVAAPAGLVDTYAAAVAVRIRLVAGPVRGLAPDVRLVRLAELAAGRP